jgi:hypothetical protein
MERLLRAASEAEDAAEAARELAAEVQDSIESEEFDYLDEDALYDLRELPTVVRKHHDNSHAGPFQWCRNPVCRHVAEVGLS